MLLLKILEIPTLEFYKSLKTIKSGLMLWHIQSHIFTILPYFRVVLDPGKAEANLIKAYNQGWLRHKFSGGGSTVQISTLLFPLEWLAIYVLLDQTLFNTLQFILHSCGSYTSSVQTPSMKSFIICLFCLLLLTHANHTIISQNVLLILFRYNL